ncbi:MAG: Ig-like domain-containing protein [Fibrobacter sp.]|nr:Ig-like domain-containing protein [Fibrobacter sp.]
MPTFKKIAAFCSSALLIFSCATVVPPDGGPEDKSPPRILAVYPPPNSTDNPEELKIVLQFDEWISDPVPKGAVRISPPVAGRVLTEVKGNMLHISSNENLDSATTYTAVISNAIKDLRNNPLGQPYTLLFSTGPQLDTLEVSGWVKIPDTALVRKNFPVVALYPMGTERQNKSYLQRVYKDSLKDSLVPQMGFEPAMLITQTDSTGRFELFGVAPGEYRIAAFIDANRNNIIDIQQEIAGVGSGEIHVKGHSLDSIFLFMDSQDTASLSLSEVSQQLGFFINLKFNRPINKENLDSIASNCGVYNKDSTLKQAANAWWPLGDTSQINLAFNYEFSEDSSYNIGCNTEDLHKFNWQNPKDTAQSSFVRLWLADHNPALDSTPLIVGTYNIPINADTILPRLRAIYDQDTIPLVGKQRYANSWEARPSKVLAKNARISIALEQIDSLKKDSTVEVKTSWRPLSFIETANPLDLTQYSGKINGCDENIVIRLYSIKNKQQYLSHCDGEGNFIFNDILVGKYFLDYFAATNQDQKPYAGSVSPYRVAEVWRFVADTIFITKETQNDSITYPSLKSGAYYELK